MEVGTKVLEHNKISLPTPLFRGIRVFCDPILFVDLYSDKILQMALGSDLGDGLSSPAKL